MRRAAVRRPTAPRRSHRRTTRLGEADGEVQAADDVAGLPLPDAREFSLQLLRQELLSIRELLAP